MPSIVDTIVIGAGFTGLSAAHALLKQGGKVLVLEARDRVGGRVESALLADGTRVDSGGQFLCDDMPNVMALARRYGKTLVRTPVEGEFLLQPPAVPQERWRIYGEAQALRERMNEIDPADPAIAGLSVADWLVQQGASVDGARAFRSMIEGLWCRPIGEVPLWFLVSNDQRITNTQSELEYFLDETIHSLAEDMALELGGRLRTGAPVDRIVSNASGVQVHSAGEMFLASQVIVAVPPVMASRIVFEPALPAPLAEALSVWKCGTVIKVLVRYGHPFWRDAGLSGMVMWRDPAGFFCCDVSREGLGAALVVFIGGPLAMTWRQTSETEQRAAILEKLASALGEDARGAIEITFRDWTDDTWSGGGYSDAIADFGATDAENIIRVGAGHIQFACSEISSSFPGYIEGAIVAGREAADRVARL